jgi:hypothetical protein
MLNIHRKTKPPAVATVAESRLLRLKDKSSHICFDKNLLENLRYIRQKSHSSKRGILEIATSALKERKRSETSSGQRSRRKGSGPSRKHTVYVKWTKDRQIGRAVHKIQWRTPSTTASGKVE